MPLNTDDLTNIERGIDAAIATILGMAQEAMARITVQHSAELAGPFIGFIQALVDNRQALAVKALQDAMIQHPDMEEGNDT